VITAVALLGWLEVLLRPPPQRKLDLGCLLEEQGDIEGARAVYRRAVDHGPPRVRENAARALQILDDPQVGG
jgi:Tfp pilus assembly protein FimV